MKYNLKLERVSEDKEAHLVFTFDGDPKEGIKLYRVIYDIIEEFDAEVDATEPTTILHG
jgi:hypothetical protein